LIEKNLMIGKFFILMLLFFRSYEANFELVKEDLSFLQMNGYAT
jgi:hypothetical protein